MLNAKRMRGPNDSSRRMQRDYSLEHLTDNELIEATARANNNSQRATALLLARIAELDHRKLYLAKAKPSMFQYALDVLGFSSKRKSSCVTRCPTAAAKRLAPSLPCKLRTSESAPRGNDLCALCSFGRATRLGNREPHSYPLRLLRGNGAWVVQGHRRRRAGENGPD